ncbi:MAG: terminase small subunit [Planctomycetota bacterium]|jgi:aspartate aminotransferase-like enzyme
MPKTKLTVIERRAVEFYAVMSKPSQVRALQAAGHVFSGKAANYCGIASRVFRKGPVRAYLQEIQEKGKQKAIEKVGVTEERVLRELEAMGFAKVGDFYDVEDGVMTLKDLQEIDSTGLSAIKQRETRFGKDGRALTTEIKLDKLRALVKLGEYLGMFKRDEEAGSVVNVHVNTELLYSVNSKEG